MTQPKDPHNEPLDGSKFNPNDYDWERHLKAALEGLPEKRLSIDKCWDYYEGTHPKVWITKTIKDKLESRLVNGMAENYCDLAVDSPVRRLAVEGFTSREDQLIVVEAVSSIWDDNKMQQRQKEVYTDARAAGESFVFAWRNDDKDSGIELNIQDARNVWWPDDAWNADPTRVVQLWADEDEGVWRATCYYKYVQVRLKGPQLREGKAEEYLPQARYFAPDPVDPGGEHGFERVPVVRFSRSKKRRSIIDKISGLQDKINKLTANMMVSAEFNAWRKMFIMTEQMLDDDTLEQRPDRISVLHPGGGSEGGSAATSIWESEATELANYSNEIDKYIDKLFTKACLPGHLKVASSREVPSGAAYEADEGPFVEDLKDMHDMYGDSWVELWRLIANVDVLPQWRNPAIRSDVDEAGVVEKFVAAGVPLLLALKLYASWTDEMLKELEESPLSPKEQLSMAAAQALANGDTGLAEDPSTGDNQSQQPPTQGV